MTARDPTAEATARPTIELDLRAGYALWSRSYDSTPNALIAVEEPLVDRLLGRLSPAATLDLGTGTGRHALRLARRGWALTALDASPEMLRIAHRRAADEHLPVECVLASLTGGLPFANERFELVICALTLCHVPDLVGALRAIERLIRPGGHLLITDFHPDAHAHGWRSWFIDADVRYAVPNIAHTRSDYVRAIAMAGLRPLEIVDLPVGAVPDGYIDEDVQRRNAELNFCLAILAVKGTAL